MVDCYKHVKSFSSIPKKLPMAGGGKLAPPKNPSLDMFHVTVRSSQYDIRSGDASGSQIHYVVIADRPSRAVCLLEENNGWKGSDKVTIEMAEPNMVPPDNTLKQEAVWKI